MTAKKVGSREALLEYLTVLRCQAGDAEAFARLHDQYRERLRRYATTLVSPDVAEDVMQDVWLTVYRRIARLTNPGAFRQWAYRITRSKALDALRKGRRQGALESALAQEAHAMEPARIVEDTEGREVESAMAGLSREHREVLQLRYFDDLPYSEIASVVGCSIGTIRSRLHHAKAALRDAFTTLGRDPLGSRKEISNE